MLAPQILNFINGEFVATGKWFDNRTPTTNAVIGQVAEAGKAEVDAAVAAARAALKGPWGSMPLAKRVELLEALVAGLPVLVSKVCGYAHYIAEADSGLVLDEPFEQTQLNEYLAHMLTDTAQRTAWSRNGLAFAETADLYSMPQHAADVILAEPKR